MITMSLINGRIRGNKISGKLWRSDEARFIQRHLPATVLFIGDIGGYNGAMALRWLRINPRSRLIVVDTVRPHRLLDGARFVQGDVCKLPFKDNLFDVVFARSVLHHVPSDVDIAVHELFRITKKGGQCIVSEPLSTPWGRLFRRISSTYHEPGEKPFMYDDLYTYLSSVFPCGTGQGFGVFAPWLSFLSEYVWFPKTVIKAVYSVDKWLIGRGFVTLAYQMVWIMEKHNYA